MAYTREQRAAKAAASAVAQPEAQDKPRTVRMVRSAETNPPPYTADVHLDEVENYARGGWRIED
jgi:hypothetical protein